MKPSASARHANQAASLCTQPIEALLITVQTTGDIQHLADETRATKAAALLRPANTSPLLSLGVLVALGMLLSVAPENAHAQTAEVPDAGDYTVSRDATRDMTGSDTAEGVSAQPGSDAADDEETAGTTASLGTIRVTADFDPDDVRPEGVTTATKTYLPPRDIPQAIDTVEVNKSKTYGINDLSIMLDGVPGVTTSYDMRGEGLTIRGFSADNNDVYRDGVRESGQVRRSTANIERIEILKGPASVLYGRGSGGGVINMISKQARFDAGSSVSLRGGSWRNVGGTFDVNHVLNRHVVMRLTADREQAHSFRSGIRNKNEMFSPSILIDTRTGLRWLGQYTWDNVWRVPDRGPSYSEMPAGVSIRTGFAMPGDFVEDRLRVLRSDLSYDFNRDWKIRWVATRRTASQDFDYVFLGTWCSAEGQTNQGQSCTWNNRIRQNYAWQQTHNETTTQTVDLTGQLSHHGIKHDLLVGFEHSEEERNPTVYAHRTRPYPWPIDPFNPSWPNGRPEREAANIVNRHVGKANAIYAQDLVSFSEQWKMLVGLRWDDYRFQSSNLVTGRSRSYDDTALSHRVGLIYQPTTTQSLYASWSRSFAPYGGRGMLNVETGANSVVDDEPQYNRQIEVGLKSDWANGRFSTQVAIYQLEHYNIRYQPDADNDPYTWALRGKDRSRGIELSATGQIIENWYIRGGVSFMKPEVAEDNESPENVGKILTNTARRNGNLFLRYAPPGKWYGEVGVTHSGKRWADTDNTVEVPGYTRWDAMVGWRANPWTLTLAITNLTDREYWRSDAMPGAPRTALFTANYQF